MKILQKAFNKHLVSKIIELGHKPAPEPDNETSRIKDLEDLKIIEENIRPSIEPGLPSVVNVLIKKGWSSEPSKRPSPQAMASLLQLSV